MKLALFFMAILLPVNLYTSEQKKRKTYNCLQKEAKLLATKYTENIQALSDSEKKFFVLYLKERHIQAKNLTYANRYLNPADLHKEINAIQRTQEPYTALYAEGIQGLVTNPSCINNSGKKIFIDEVDLVRIILASKSFSYALLKIMDSIDTKSNVVALTK